MDIDLVYTWVDGNDSEWIKRKEQRLRGLGMPVPVTANHSCRFVQHDELKYSLRSVHAFAPWIHKVFIITDKQIPSWLNKDDPWVQIVDHTEIFGDRSCLPTFNASAIETKLHRIAGLSEYFIYFNDDFFLGRPCSKHDFVANDGKPFVYITVRNSFMSKKRTFELDEIRKQKNEYQAGLVNSRWLIHGKYGKLVKFTIAHGLRVYQTSIMSYLEEVFKNEFADTASKPFRTYDDILSYAILDYYLSASNKGRILKVPKFRARRHVITNLIAICSSYLFIYLEVGESKFKNKLRQIDKYKPFMFCINDSSDGTDDDYSSIGKFLERKFPDKSPAEM